MGDAAPVSQEIRLPTDVAGLTAATKKLDEMIARVDRLERASERHHKKSESEWGGVEKSVNKAKNAVQEFMGFIGATIAFEALEKVADKFIEIGKEALKAAANAERMNFAIDAAAGGKEAGESTRKWLEANAKHSEFSEAQNESAYLFLKRYGVGQQKAGLFMKGAEDLAAIAAPDQREGVYQEALSALARVHARGKIDTRSAMRLGIGVEDFATLPQFKGQSKKAIAKALQNGSANVGENDLLNLIMHRTGEKAIGEKSADASQLLLTRMSKLSELPERFFKRLGETSAVKRLSDEIGSMVDKLDPDSPNGKKIFAALEAVFETLADTVGKIDFDEVASVVTDDVLPAFKLMASMIEPTVEAIERIVRGLHRMAPLAEAAMGPLAVVGGAAAMTNPAQRAQMKSMAAAAITGKTEQQLGEMGFFGRALQGAKGALHTSVGMATGGHFVPFREEFAASHRAAGIAAGQGFTQGIQASMPPAESASMSLGESSHGALMSSIDAHSPSRKTEEAGGHFGEGYALGIERSSGRIADAMDSTFRVPASMFSAPSVAGLGGGGAQITFAEGAIQITVTGGGPDTAAAVRDELERSLRPMFVDILEGTRGGGGIG